MGKASKEAKHIVADGERKVLICKNCGTEEAIILNSEVENFLGQINNFTKKHLKCKKKK